MFSDYIGAVLLIFFAEMGDKTQFLAMAFATKYPVKKILIGVALGAFFNHGLAMLLGRILIKFVTGNIISFIAGLMFIFFAFMSLKIDDEEIEESNTKYGAVITVALAFFLGELGDKTQLAALGLSVDSTYVPMVLLGTVTGMVLTSSLGILVGLKLGKKIPEDKLKMSAFLIFIIFGIQKLYNSYLSSFNTIMLIVLSFLFASAVFYALRRFKIKYKSIEETAFTRQAEMLKKTREKIIFKIDNLCKGLENCITCDETECLVGYMKEVIKSGNKPINRDESIRISKLKDKSFNKEEATEIIKLLMEYYDHYESEFAGNDILKELRKTAEFIAFSKYYEEEDYKAYKNKINSTFSL